MNMKSEQMPTIDSLKNGEKKERPILEKESSHSEEYIQDAVIKIQKLFIDSATKYLDKESDHYLREQIIKFYSDGDRLNLELSNVFRGVKEADVFTKIEQISKSFAEKESFIKYVETKNFATSPAERRVEEERISSIYEAKDAQDLRAVRSEINEISEQMDIKEVNWHTWKNSLPQAHQASMHAFDDFNPSYYTNSRGEHLVVYTEDDQQVAKKLYLDANKKGISEKINIAEILP